MNAMYIGLKWATIQAWVKSILVCLHWVWSLLYMEFYLVINSYATTLKNLVFNAMEYSCQSSVTNPTQVIRQVQLEPTSTESSLVN